MESLTYKAKIVETFQNVRKFSFQEKKEAAFDEAKINKLLDKILEFKRSLTAKTDKINSLVESIEQITWFSEVDNDALMSINDLISSIRDLHSSLLRQYISMNLIRKKGIALEEVKKFKISIDDLKEGATDLDSRFFFLPDIARFQETTKELSLI